MMHDDRVNCITFNAFNGFSDSTGSDDYGVSVAWIDLDDHLEPDGLDHHELYPHSDDVSAYVKTLPEIDGAQFALAYWHASGIREVQGFSDYDEMMSIFRSFEADYSAWIAAQGEDA